MAKPLRIGICGTGIFAQWFIPVFKAHPSVAEVVLCDHDPGRLAAAARRHGIERTVADLDELLLSDVDAVAIFTPRDLHAPVAARALRAGKHVYCAVPAAQTLAELEELLQLVRETGLTYMIGETSYYYPVALYCRERFRAGHFGAFVYGEGEYLHDMAHGFYHAFRLNGGVNWKARAGFPPMLYPTHSTSMLVSVFGQRLSSVSSLGYVDCHDDGIFREEANPWKNRFSNESALFRTSGGGMFRVNEFRRVGHGTGNCVRASFFGTHGCFEQQCDSHAWTDLAKGLWNVNDLLECEVKPEGDVEEGVQEDFKTGLARIHPVERLPEQLLPQPNGHSGSHYFLVDDFIRSIRTGKLPPNHIWNAIRYTAPGIVAHESSRKEGERLEVPDFGDPPPEASFLDDELPNVSPEAKAHIQATAPDLSKVETGEEALPG
jgi:predicted dehydrogenase